ncbi:MULTISPECIES: TonB-dependent siderophore receptor [Sphingobium]|uniref:TonB-dependent receptor n=1 Tax=Sphingobium fuliginis ATCC 27551 TaxID=1208342 RepID=A0A5B8CLB9_SPHSA|nr:MULTISPECIES: TonB-dependent receptor [Sphingobium]QDC39300.1 TonB-dependent receptor [Sphingobium fuliginis ATCC 27551]
MHSVKIWAGAGVALAAVALAQGAQAQAQPADNAAAAAASERDAIIVTGTRRTDRTVSESAVPVDVFSAGDLASQATSDIKAAIKNLVPSFNLQRNALFDGSAFVRPPTLRGLPPDETLVLINGKRVHRSALVQVSGGSLAAGSQSADLSQIPGAAVQRVEVLRDGAAAQYGSDAIAGVINFALKSNAEGLSLNARYGEYYEGDGRDIQLSGNWGLKLGNEGGFINLTGEYINAHDTNRAVQRPDAVVLETLGYDVKRPVTKFGSPDTEAYRFFVNAELPLGDDALYFFGNYGYSDQVIDFNYRRPIAVTTTGPAGSPFTFGKSISLYYLDRNADGTWNADGRTWNDANIFPNGFTPRFRSTNTDISAVGGYKGEIGGLHYDASIGYGQNRIKYYISDTFNPSLGPDSPTDFYDGSLEQRELNANLDLSYPLEIGLASPLNIAGGFEYRRESFLIGAGDAASYTQGIYASQTVRRADGSTFLVTHPVGSNGFPGYGPTSIVDRSRASQAAYLDLEVDVTPRFTLGGAVRYEHYDDFGGTTNVKATARYAFSDAIALRGAASTGFRAPTPGQLYLRNLQTSFIGTNPVPVQIATLSPEDAAARYYGATALKPEESVNFSGGLVLTPTPSFTITADYYNIKVTNRIGLTSRVSVTDADRVQLAALGVVDPNSLGAVQYFTNGFGTRTQGVDFVANYRANTGWGKLGSSLAVNYNRTKLSYRRTITLPGGRSLQLIDDERKRDIETLLPRWRGVFTQTAEAGPVDVVARANYFGKFTNNQLASNGGNKTFGAEVSFDLEVGVKVADKLRIAVGGENIFDNYPDRETRLLYPSTGAPASGFVYPDASPLGVLGGFWYLRVSAEL